jgi:hypothetical protein
MIPDIATELDDRTAQREKIEALLLSQPMQTVEPDELRKITPHYQQRISESRRHGLRIENVPRFLALADGTTKRLDGAYRWVPHKPLGRDAGTFVERRWSETGPYQEEFRLK